MSPEKAYEYAKINGPNKKTRITACLGSYYAYFYPKNIDKEPTEETSKDD